MLDIFRRPAVIIIVIVAIIGALIWSYFTKKSSQTNISTEDPAVTTQLLDLTTIDANEFNDALGKELANAQAKAAEANINNKLSSVDVDMPSLEMNSGDTRYIFTSPTDTNNNWTITFNQKTGNSLRAIIPKADYLGALSEINTTLWKFNYITAIQIAEKNDGLKWREQNGLTGVRVTLKNGGKNNWLLWTVVYTSGSNTFTRQIDANSGKIITE